MTEENILNTFRESGALLSGHFQLTSGLHSDTYFQCALVLQYPKHAEKLCGMAKDFFGSHRIDAVVAPAVGGIVVGYEVARQLGARALFAERQEGEMTLRRGFQLTPGERVLVAEDVVTTGGSVKEVVQLAQHLGAEVQGVFAIVDRSGGRAHFGVPFRATVQMRPVVYEPAQCPLCQQGVPVHKPGSRGLA